MKPQIPWLRVFVEGVVIVGSILLAFGIQAAWDERQERELYRESLTNLRTELIQSAELLHGSLTVLEGSRESAGEILKFTGPDPPNVSPDSLGEMIESAMLLSVPEISTATLDGLVSSGMASTIQNDSLRVMVVRWPASVADVSRQYEWLRSERDEVWEPLVAESFPLRNVLSRLGNYGPSRFTPDVRALLSDPQFEARVAERIQGSSALLGKLELLLATAEEMLHLIEVEAR